MSAMRTEEIVNTDDEAQGPKLFDAVLYPHRSLTPAGFWVLMSLVVVVSFMAGMAFVVAGAWPVLGFFGIDALLLYWCFQLNYRSGRLYETVELTERELVVKRVTATGRVNRWSFQPFWLRVEIDDPPRQGSPLVLTSHGQSLSIGSFLSPEERLQLAQALRTALQNLRS